MEIINTKDQFRYLFNLFYLIFFLYFLSSQYNIAFADAPLQKKISSQKENIECPVNSYCNKKSAATRNRWMKFIKKVKGTQKEISQQINQYSKKEGIPILVWSTINIDKEYQFIYWESPCKHHKKKFYLAETFVRNIKKLKDVSLITGSIHILGPKKKIQHFQVPIRSKPYYLENGNPVYLNDEMGIIYGVKILPDGSIKTVPIEKAINPPREIKCPQELKDFVRKNIQNKESQTANTEAAQEIYLDSYCKKIWDIKKGSSSTVLLNWSCN